MAGYGRDQFAVTSMPLGSINLGESLQKPVEDGVPRRDVATDPDIPLAQLAGQRFVPIPCLRVFERAQDPRQTLVEPVVEPAQELGITDLELRFVRKPLFHILLDFDVDPAFQLEGALGGVRGVVLPHRSFDIGRMGVVAFDHRSECYGPPSPSISLESIKSQIEIG